MRLVALRSLSRRCFCSTDALEEGGNTDPLFPVVSRPFTVEAGGWSQTQRSGQRLTSLRTILKRMNEALRPAGLRELEEVGSGLFPAAVGEGRG